MLEWQLVLLDSTWLNNVYRNEHANMMHRLLFYFIIFIYMLIIRDPSSATVLYFFFIVFEAGESDNNEPT